MKFLIIALLAIAVASGNPVQSEKKICEPGTQRKQDCNTCTCSPNGLTEFCTLMFCSPGVHSETRNRRGVIITVCSPNELKFDGCRSCMCREDGSGWNCGPSNCQPKTCNPGEQYMKDCNRCSCSADGRSEICTTQKCPKVTVSRHSREIGEEVICEPGANYKEYCNDCKCSTDGKSAACTMMLCDETVYNKDGSLKNETANKQ